MLSKRLQTTLQRKKTCSMLSQNSCDNIAQLKSWGNVQETPDNIAQEKILFNVVLILLGQHCTGKIYVQCCPRGSRQYSAGKKLVRWCNVQEAPDNIAQEKILFNVVLILLGQHCIGKIYVQCCPRGSRQYCAGKKPVRCCLNTLGTTLHS